MILVNGKEMPDNNRFRTRLICKLKNNPSILVGSFDISKRNSKSKSSFNNTPIFYRISNLEDIYHILKNNKNIPNEIIEKIIYYVINCADYININKELKYNIGAQIVISDDNDNYKVNLYSSPTQTSNSYSIKSHNYIQLINYIHYCVNNNFKNLLNKKKPFEVDEIYIFKNPQFELIYFI